MNPKGEALQLLRESLSELEASKGSIVAGVQKLLRAAHILEREDIAIWCSVQLGQPKYTTPLQALINALVDSTGDQDKESEEKITKATGELAKTGIVIGNNFSLDQLEYITGEAGGGLSGIGFIEQKYADLVRNKRGNDGTYYKSNLARHIEYVRQAAHSQATTLFNEIAFAEAPKSAFDFLRNEVDDKLLDLKPELAEKLMVAFKAVASTNPEEWSHALTTCRRLIEDLADVLYPPTEGGSTARRLGKAQYINRLWAYMDQAIESESNRELAKSHVDFLGSYLERIHKLSNKGVHSSLTKVEAVKAVFHTYMMLADLLGYLAVSRQDTRGKLNIHTATLDEIESLLGTNRAIAKEIVKLRVQHGVLTPDILGQVKGVGSKTIANAKAAFSFMPAKGT